MRFKAISILNLNKCNSLNFKIRNAYNLIIEIMNRRRSGQGFEELINKEWAILSRTEHQ